MLPGRYVFRYSCQALLCFLCFALGGNYYSSRPCQPGRRGANEPALSAWRGPEARLKAFLVVLLVSSPKNTERRRAIRRTWLNLPKRLRRDVRAYFAVGTDHLPEGTRDDLDEEQLEHGDLLRLPLDDSFSQLTHKVLRSMSHAAENVEFDYLLKVDDDSFVRVDALLEELKDSNYREGLYWGYFDGRAPVAKSPKNKWHEKEYAICDRYLPYALGGGYVLSHDLVKYIADNADLLQQYRNEDVSVGTWLAPLKIHRVHDVRFDTEFRSRGCLNSYLVTHKQSVEEMRSKQYSLDSRGVLCEKEVQDRSSYVYDWGVPPSLCCKRDKP